MSHSPRLIYVIWRPVGAKFDESKVSGTLAVLNEAGSARALDKFVRVRAEGIRRGSSCSTMALNCFGASAGVAVSVRDYQGHPKAVQSRSQVPVLVCACTTLAKGQAALAAESDQGKTTKTWHYQI